MFEYDVCIIGTGRVGLPLGLSLVDAGVKATGVDIDSNMRESVNDGRMPFHEPGYDDIIARKEFIVHASPADVVPSSSHLVITVGTPLHNHIETDLSQIQVLASLGSTSARGRPSSSARWPPARPPTSRSGSNAMR